MVAAYQQYGTEGLLRRCKNEIYPFDFKLHIVELYLTIEVSYQELAVQVGMNNPLLIAKWVNDFRIVGSDALKSKCKRRCSEVKKATDITIEGLKIQVLIQGTLSNLKKEI